MGLKDTDGIANSVSPDQTDQSDLGLHCLTGPMIITVTKVA